MVPCPRLQTPSFKEKYGLQGKDHWWLSPSYHHPWNNSKGIFQTAVQHLLRRRQHMRLTQPPSQVLLLKWQWQWEAGTLLAGSCGSFPVGSCCTSIFSEDFANIRHAESGPKESDGLTPGFYRVLGNVKAENHNPSVFKFSCLKQYLFQKLSEKKRQQHEYSISQISASGLNLSTDVHLEARKGDP